MGFGSSFASLLVLLSSSWNVSYFALRRQVSIPINYPRDQSDAQSSRSSPGEKLTKFTPIASSHHYIALFFFTIIIVENTILAIFSLGYFDDYALLDCFLLGRFRYIGKATRIGPWAPLPLVFFFGIYRVVMAYYTGLEFRFQLTEFMLYEREFVAKVEHTFGGGLESYNWSMDKYANFKYSTVGSIPSWMKQHKRVFCVKNPFWSGQQPYEAPRVRRLMQGKKWYLRPSRTLTSWSKMTNYYQCFLPLIATTLVFSLICIPFYFGGPILTNEGYEMAYPKCVFHLKSLQSEKVARGEFDSLPFGWIYVPAKSGIYADHFDPTLDRNETKLVSELSVDRFPFYMRTPTDLSHIKGWFPWTRVVVDFVIQSFMMTEFTLLGLGVWLATFSIGADVYINAQGIKVLLEDLVGEMHRSKLNSAAKLPCLEIRPDHEGVLHKTIKVQAILVDHFGMVRNYSRYANLICALLLGLFFTQLSIIYYWVAVVVSGGIQFEFVVTELFCTIMAAVLIYNMAVPHSANLKLYTLITSAMALDQTCLVTKMRWTSIVKYYTPNALFCFTFLGDYTISCLFIIKFIAWVVSAYLILVNFLCSRSSNCSIIG